MKVKELRGLDDETHTQEGSEDDIEMEAPVERDQGQCRICLYEENEPRNPLVTPCSCSGSVKYLHLGCLQKWIASRKLTREGENSVNSYWRSMDCEICKSAFPLKISSQGKEYDLFTQEKLMKPYVILETMNVDRASEIYVISLFNKFSVKMGRGHDSDIRISDISVSRVHASIKYQDGTFFFADNDSKFGTLMLLKEPVGLLLGKPVHVQIGRSVFIITVGETSDLREVD